MGQTLENGVYLPSEGERNCYDGLASNWRSVDTNIGYISALRQAIAGALTRKIVTELPTEDIDPNCIYMILKTTPQTNNVYNEWMYISNAWELIGDTQLDLSDYYTKQEVNQLPAVASGVTSTKVGNYDAHIANGDIHVTASDKTKWNTVALIKQLRLVNTRVGSATTIAFANIDDTNGIKVGDKCMDLDGRMFEITAVDTTNQTVTVGSALVDLALDANVVHTSGDEAITGSKRFGVSQSFTGYPSIRLSTTDDINVLPSSATQRDIRFTDKNNAIMSYFVFQHRSDANEPFRTCWRQNRLDGTENYYSVNFNNLGEFYPENNNAIKLGTRLKRWSEVYATNYYYGSNNVEFSTKFVTTDTAQTISGNKTFSSINGVEPSSLSLPDLDNGIDISSYITVNGGNKESFYTPTVNGWISVALTRTGGANMAVMLKQGNFASSGHNIAQENGTTTCNAMLPVKGGVQVSINSALADGIAFAYFYPCLGNV